MVRRSSSKWSGCPGSRGSLDRGRQAGSRNKLVELKSAAGRDTTALESLKTAFPKVQGDDLKKVVSAQTALAKATDRLSGQLVGFSIQSTRIVPRVEQTAETLAAVAEAVQAVKETVGRVSSNVATIDSDGDSRQQSLGRFGAQSRLPESS